MTSRGRLDISFVPDGTTGYADLADVIRSKQAANRPKDQRVLMTLREIVAHRDTGDRR